LTHNNVSKDARTGRKDVSDRTMCSKRHAVSRWMLITKNRIRVMRK
jgi:hypothetical protein